MKKFDKFNLKKSSALQISVHNKLDNMRLANYEDLSKFFTEPEKNINESRICW